MNIHFDFKDLVSSCMNSTLNSALSLETFDRMLSRNEIMEMMESFRMYHLNEMEKFFSRLLPCSSSSQSSSQSSFQSSKPNLSPVTETRLVKEVSQYDKEEKKGEEKKGEEKKVTTASLYGPVSHVVSSPSSLSSRSSPNQGVFHHRQRLLITSNRDIASSLIVKWNRSLKTDSSFEFVSSYPYDRAIVLGSTSMQLEVKDPSKIIYFPKRGVKYTNHADNRTEVEIDVFCQPWSLPKSRDELISSPPITKTKVIATILPDPDDKRNGITFPYAQFYKIQHLELLEHLKKLNIPIDVFPSTQSREIFQEYKYALVIEPFSVQGDLSEAVMDGVLSECLVLYRGCDSIRKLTGTDAIGFIHLSNVKEDAKKIQECIRSQEWERMSPKIKKLKTGLIDRVFGQLEEVINK